MNTVQSTGFYGCIPPRGVSTNSVVGRPVGGTSGGASYRPSDQNYQPELFKILEMLKEQKQLINSVVETQKELEKNVESIKSEVAGVKKEMSDLSVSLMEDNSHKKETKLPKPVTSAVKKLHQQLENHFNPSKLLLDEYNQKVSLELQAKLKHEFEDHYPERTIKRAVSRHYESRRREYLDAQPNREAAKELNIKNTKIRSRKRQLYQRRLRQCKTAEERKIFLQIDEAYMTEESDSPDGNSFLQHQPVWRSDKLDKIIKVLDKRGSSVTQSRFKKLRVLSSPLTSSPPVNAPSWALSTETISRDSTDIEISIPEMEASSPEVETSTPGVKTSSTPELETSSEDSIGEYDSQEPERYQDSTFSKTSKDIISTPPRSTSKESYGSASTRENTFFTSTPSHSTSRKNSGSASTPKNVSTLSYSTSRKKSGSASTSKRTKKQIVENSTPIRQMKVKPCPIFAFEDDLSESNEDEVD